MKKIANHVDESILEIEDLLNTLIDSLKDNCDMNFINRHSIIEYLVNAKQDLKMAYKLNEIYKEKCECESNCKK